MTSSVRLDGTVLIGGEEVGHLVGFTFTPAPAPSTSARPSSTPTSPSLSGLSSEISRRVSALCVCEDAAFRLSPDGFIIWRDAEIARLTSSLSLYAPSFDLCPSPLLTPAQASQITTRLSAFLPAHITQTLAPLMALSPPETPPESPLKTPPESPPKLPSLSPPAQHITHALYQSMGTLPRSAVASQLDAITATDKPILARLGIRLGIELLYMPALLKPSSIDLRVMLYCIHHGLLGSSGGTLYCPSPPGRVSFPAPPPPAAAPAPPPGRVSFPAPAPAAAAPTPPPAAPAPPAPAPPAPPPPAAAPPPPAAAAPTPPVSSSPLSSFWHAFGYHPLGSHIIRADMVERVSAIVRASSRLGSFSISDAMLSLAGVGHADMVLILADLGYTQITPNSSPDSPILFTRKKPTCKRKHSPSLKSKSPKSKSPKSKSPKSKSPKSKSPKSKSKPQSSKSRPRRSSKPQPSKPPSKPEIDPLSPFAVLAKLKLPPS